MTTIADNVASQDQTAATAAQRSVHAGDLFIYTSGTVGTTTINFRPSESDAWVPLKTIAAAGVEHLKVPTGFISAVVSGGTGVTVKAQQY